MDMIIQKPNEQNADILLKLFNTVYYVLYLSPVYQTC